MILPRLLLPAALLLAAAPQDGTPDIQVTGPGKPNAQTPATLVVEPAAMFVASCDDDHDGFTRRAELDACIARTLAGRGDAGNDGGAARGMGYLAYADWALRWLGDRTALPSPFEIDRDGDDRITLAELQAQFSRLFSRYDRDGDGAVSRAEALTIRAAPADGKRERERDGSRPGKRDRPKGERIPGGQP